MLHSMDGQSMPLHVLPQHHDAYLRANRKHLTGGIKQCTASQHTLPE